MVGTERGKNGGGFCCEECRGLRLEETEGLGGYGGQ